MPPALTGMPQRGNGITRDTQEQRRGRAQAQNRCICRRPPAAGATVTRSDSAVGRLGDRSRCATGHAVRLVTGGDMRAAVRSRGWHRRSARMFVRHCMRQATAAMVPRRPAVDLRPGERRRPARERELAHSPGNTAGAAAAAASRRAVPGRNRRARLHNNLSGGRRRAPKTLPWGRARRLPPCRCAARPVSRKPAVLPRRNAHVTQPVSVRPRSLPHRYFTTLTKP